MEDVKPWYLSKGVLGPLIAIAAMIAGVFGFKIDPATQSLIVDQAVAGISGLVAIIGSFIGIWGRITATKVIQ